MKLVVLDGFANNPGDLDWSCLQSFGDLTVRERTSPEDVRRIIGDAEVVFTNKVRLGKKELEDTKVRYIGVIATGYDVIDLDYCNNQRITVTNVPGYSSDSVAQMTFAHILNYMNRIDLYAKENRQGRWAESRDFVYYLNTTHDIASMTLGIYGYGSIGKKVAEIARAFGMEVIAYSHRGKKEAPYVEEDEFFKRSHIISLHAPLNDTTRHFICKETLEKVRDGVILVNTARGPLVNEEELISYLDSGRVAAYLSDVLAQEPMAKNHLFLHREDVFLTPHLAWASFESRKKLMRILFDNVQAFLDGNPQNVVSQ
ncbi:MAG: D-2-hydroxyacid dehydrogenase [Tissierellia bacterium]|nr:D-2-hydroxyacid dehydrogenase [Tissierellia bacterium]